MVKGSLLLSGLALAIGGKAEADTISLKPMADSYIQQFSPDVNAGGDFSNVAGALGSTKNGEVRRIFMRFDLSNLVPQNAVINSVTLQVTVVNVPQFAVDSYFDLKRLLKPWTESGVTWNTATPGNPWEQAGATGSSDSVPSPSSSVLVSVLGQYTFSSSDQLRQDVQGWVANPSSNNGWLMMSEDEGTEETARRFGAREDPPDAAVLTVDYSIPQLSITAQPQSQTNFVGGSVTFQVAAAGTTPFSYQWFFNNNPLPDETNSTLTLDNLQTNQTGPYFVTVTNSSGSTNSQIAFLSVEPLPRGVPIVTIISPTNGARFPAHADITLAASAAESNGVITQVEFFVGTNSAGVVSSPPYMLTTNNVPAGNYSVRAVATDDSGNRGASPTISFSVFDPPGVTVTTPPAGSRFPLGTNITVTATVASKGARIIGVDFFATRTNRATGAIDTTNIGSASAAPYTISWLPADTGDYSLTATVTDELGQTGQTPSIFVRIFIPELILPVITITDGPANLSRVTSSPITFSGTANDNIGMDYVELVSSSGPFLIVPGSVVRAEGTTNWSASIAPAPGKNLIRFHGVDLANNRSADLTRIVTYVTQGQLTIQINGEGSVSPDLNGRSLELGKIHTVQAHPAAGQIFLGWSGVSPTNNTKVSFEMKSNLVLTATFVPNPFLAVAGTYSGLFLDADTNRFRPENAGFFRLQLAKDGSFSGKVTMQEGSYGFHGKFDPYGNAQISIVRRALPPVTFALQLDLANGTDSITGTATTSSGGNVLSAALIADRNVFDASKNPAAQAGQYSFVLETLEDGQTFAAGNASVGKSGAVQIHGALNSGSKFSAGSALAKDGNVALFVSVGKGMDVLAGWLNFGGTDESGRGGKVYWVHAASSGVVLLEQATP